MTPRRGDVEYAALFDARGKLIVPKAILLLLDGQAAVERKLERDYETISALPCKMPPQSPCVTTQHVAIPPEQPDAAQMARDAAIGGAVRRAWHAIPHVYRCIITIAGSAVGGVSLWPAIKAAITHLVSSL